MRAIELVSNQESAGIFVPFLRVGLVAHDGVHRGQLVGGDDRLDVPALLDKYVVDQVHLQFRPVKTA